MVKLNAKNLIKYFAYKSHRLQVLGSVNLNVSSEGFTCLIGPYRCNQFTFLRVMTGLAQSAFTLFDDLHIVKTGLLVFQKCMILMFVTRRVTKVVVSQTKILVFGNRPFVIKNESKDRRLPSGVSGDENLIGLQRQMLVNFRPKVKENSQHVYNSNNNNNANNKKYARPDATNKQHITKKEATT